MSKKLLKISAYCVFSAFVFTFKVCCGMNDKSMCGVLIDSSQKECGSLDVVSKEFGLRAKDIKEIKLENQRIDADFLEKWNELFGVYCPDKILFDKCSFLNQGKYIFNQLAVSELIVTGCNLQTSDLMYILGIDPYQRIDKLDLSDNNLGADKNLLIKIIEERIIGVYSIRVLNLKNNNIYNNLELQGLPKIKGSIENIVLTD